MLPTLEPNDFPRSWPAFSALLPTSVAAPATALTVAVVRACKHPPRQIRGGDAIAALAQVREMNIRQGQGGAVEIDLGVGDQNVVHLDFLGGFAGGLGGGVRGRRGAAFGAVRVDVLLRFC